MEPSKCPLLELNAFVDRGGMSMGLRDIRMIENHMSPTTSCPHPPLKDLVFNEGTTPLLLACHYGEIEAVKRIVEIWGADIQATGVYYKNPGQLSDGKIDEASPLFVAASRSYFEIVRYLVEKGADATTKTTSNAEPQYHGLTPLHGAFLSDLNQRVYMNGIGYAVITDIAIILLEAGADPSALPFDRTPMWKNLFCCQKASNHHRPPWLATDHGNISIIHTWAGLDYLSTEESSFSLFKILVDNGVDQLLNDDQGNSPLFAAAHDIYGTLFNLRAFDFLLKRDKFSRMEKIEALELAGAVILTRSDDASKFLKAFDYWRRAVELRHMEEEGSGPIIKIPLKKGSGGTVEWSTSEELERVIRDPSEHKIQAFLVLLRILSGKNWGALESLLGSSRGELNRYRNDLTHQDAMTKLLDISQAALESLGRFEENTLSMSYHIIDAIYYLVEALVSLERVNQNLLTVETIKRTLALISEMNRFLYDENGKVLQSTFYHLRQMESLLRLVKFLVTSPSLQDATIVDNVKNERKKFLQSPRCDDSERVLLHYACNNPQYLSLPIIGFLIESGADLTTADMNGDGPLHFLARLDHLNYVDRELVASAANLLLENGAHFDQVNNSRKTAADVWNDRQEEKANLKRDHEEAEDDEEEEDEDDGELGFDDPPLKMPPWLSDHPVLKLMCIAAKFIRSQKVPYCPCHSCLPKNVNRFMKFH